MSQHQRTNPIGVRVRAILSRRQFIGGSAALMTAALVGGAPRAMGQTPEASPLASTDASDGALLLAIADPASARLFAYDLPAGQLISELPDIVVQTHAGFLPLPTGELLFVDEQTSRLVIVGLTDGTLQITHEEPVPGPVSHVAVDSDHMHFVAIGSGDTSSPITLIDVEAWDASTVSLPDTGEVGLMLNHDVLFHRNDVLNRLEAYPLDALLAGETTPVSTVEIGAGGHGESIDLATDRLYCATNEGIEAVAWDGSALTYLTTYPWSDDASISGRGYFQRLTVDGRYVVSYISDRSAPETEWTAWTNFAMVVDTVTGDIWRPELGNGYVYRFGLAEQRALFSVMGDAGDEAVVLDLDPVSATFGTITTRIPLEPMAGGPAPTDPIYDIGQYRSVTITPDGRLGAVTHGGDGRVSLLDLEAGEVVQIIETPTALDGGGYLGVFSTAEAFTDTIAR